MSMSLKNSAIRLAALLVMQGLCLAAAHAQLSVNPKLSEEIAKQENIYQGKGEQRPEGYVIDRSLLAYTFTLAPGFDRSLADLTPADRWLDIGAGQGQAVLDYYTPRYDAMHVEGRDKRGKKARSVAMSIEDRRTPLWQQTAAGLEDGKIRYLFGKRLREYTREELGSFQLITDVIGGFSYAVDLSLFLEKTLALLNVGGNFYTLLQDVHSEEGTNKPHYAGATYLTEISRADGSKLRICPWLKSVSCVQVTCELRQEWKPAIEVYHIRKTCD